MRYREAVGLQMEAFWSRNYLILVGAGAAALCIVLWRIMFGVASTFVGLSEGMAKYGFLALATAMVAFSVSFSMLIYSWCCKCVDTLNGIVALVLRVW